MSRDFDGVDDRVNCGNSSLFDITGDITVSAWVYFNTEPPASNAYQVVAKDKDTGGRAYTLDWLNESAGVTKFRFYINGGANGDLVDSADWNGSQWVFVAGTFRTSDNLLSIYVNGLLEESKSTVADSIPTATANLTIGAREYGGFENFADGIIAYAELHNADLSREIIQVMRFPGSVRRGLVGFWPLFGTASPEPDYSGNGNHGTVTGAVKGTSDPPINGIYQVPRPELIHSF